MYRAAAANDPRDSLLLDGSGDDEPGSSGSERSAVYRRMDDDAALFEFDNVVYRSAGPATLTRPSRLSAGSGLGLGLGHGHGHGHGLGLGPSLGPDGAGGECGAGFGAQAASQHPSDPAGDASQIIGWPAAVSWPAALAVDRDHPPLHTANAAPGVWSFSTAASAKMVAGVVAESAAEMGMEVREAPATPWVVRGTFGSCEAQLVIERKASGGAHVELVRLGRGSCAFKFRGHFLRAREVILTQLGEDRQLKELERLDAARFLCPPSNCGGIPLPSETCQ